MRAVLTICAVLCGLCLMPKCVRAEVDSTEILIKALVNKGIITQQDADGVREEIVRLRKEEEAKRTTHAVTGKRPIKVSGYIQEKYTHFGQAGANDTLEVSKARLTLTGDATDKLDFRASWELAGSRTVVSSVNFPAETVTTTKAGRPTLVEADLGYKLPDDKRIDVGQFYIPFSMEGTLSDAKTDFINRSRVVDSLMPGRDTGNSGRDIGVQFSGKALAGKVAGQEWQYFAGLFNGSGINTADDNDHKDPALRVVYNSSPIGLSVGGSYYSGELGAAETDRRRLGFEAALDRDEWALKGEYIRADDAALGADGWYATVLRRFGPKIDGLVRYDIFDPDKDSGGDATKTLTVGVNWNLNRGGYSRCQLNYESKREQGPQVSNDLLLAQFQAGF